ncbi:MAG TPA: HDOD domain-containing protein [Sedimenticola thiotaurini]|uniref:HDOD domain-containing protein n=1 Tax=Sedimenticola thiotaurini TaxID=1543721 RepID=A0A831W2B7_9GAMM|nr:HDOD domain-containing protein [Sedimenticola thiotaurini]
MIDPATISGEQLQKRYYVPPQPEILQRLLQIKESPEPDVISAANLVAADVGLASAVLRTINSPYFGMRGRVADIRQAAVLLGTDALFNLVTVYQLRQALQLPACLQLGRFWDTSSETARTCVRVGRMRGIPIPKEELYALGLFHDCGIPLMAQLHPDYREVLAWINTDYERSATAIERERYGNDHSVLGFVVATTWGLPSHIAGAILQNHERDLWDLSRDDTLKTLVAVLKWSQNLVDRAHRGCDNPDWAHHRDGVCRTLGMDEEELESPLPVAPPSQAGGHC